MTINRFSQDRPSSRVPGFFRAGLYSLLVTILLGVTFALWSAQEQAQNPGQKNLGVAVLAMMFLPAILLLGAFSVGTLLVTGSVLLYRRLSVKK